MDERKPNDLLRKMRGKRSRKEVAEATGITERSLKAYELGERIPSDKVKIKLAEYYKRSVQHLFF